MRTSRHHARNALDQPTPNLRTRREELGVTTLRDIQASLSTNTSTWTATTLVDGHGQPSAPRVPRYVYHSTALCFPSHAAIAIRKSMDYVSECVRLRRNKFVLGARRARHHMGMDLLLHHERRHPNHRHQGGSRSGRVVRGHKMERASTKTLPESAGGKHSTVHGGLRACYPEMPAHRIHSQIQPERSAGARIGAANQTGRLRISRGCIASRGKGNCMA